MWIYQKIWQLWYFLLDKIDKKVIFEFGRGRRSFNLFWPRMVTKITATYKVLGAKTSSFWFFTILFWLHGYFCPNYGSRGQEQLAKWQSYYLFSRIFWIQRNRTKKIKKIQISDISQMTDVLNSIPKETLLSPDLKKEVRYLFTDRGFKSNYLTKQWVNLIQSKEVIF